LNNPLRKSIARARREGILHDKKKRRERFFCVEGEGLKVARGLRLHPPQHIPLSLASLLCPSLVIFLISVSLSLMHSSAVPPSHSRTLFVIAHPDDEAMFFAPTILSMHNRSQLHLICLSVGNNDGLGKVREKELYKSCAVLGIPEERVRIYDEEGLHDGMKNHWDSSLVLDIVKNAVEEFQINTVCKPSLIIEGPISSLFLRSFNFFISFQSLSPDFSHLYCNLIHFYLSNIV
jgi:hypothetical protein